MKKSGILNASLSRIVAALGHTDRLVICDPGLPIPNGYEIVDLALTSNIPRFLDTLRVILEEFEVESAVVASELINNDGLFEEIKNLLPGKDIETIPHENFKEMMRNGSKIAFVRTGEITPYANIILNGGVTFG